MFSSGILAIFFLWAGVLSNAAVSSNAKNMRRQESTIEPAQSQNTSCYDVMVLAEQNVTIFWASDVFDCLKNVPFDEAVAIRFIDYYNQTLQFQSTLAFLADPPEGYQQPPVDVQAELEGMKANASAGVYTSQYVFEAELQLLINRMHDNHVVLDAGILAAFTFASPYPLVSVSEDGKKAPSIYLTEDVVSSSHEGWMPSPVVQINGVDVVEYLTRFAELNSDGYLEPHADWNAIMDNPARDIQGYLSVLQRANLYPGDELTFTFANDSTLETWWWAVYREMGSTGPLTTAGDFFNYFVLDLLPANYDPDNSTKWWPDEKDYTDTSKDYEIINDTSLDYGCSNGNPRRPNWCKVSMGAYPNDPVVSQRNLSITGAGAVSGYFLDDISTGVLSVPSFYQTGDDVSYFNDAVNEFIDNATARNTSRVVIDLQQNGGGMTLLALTMFKQFFYRLDPYTGSRIRSHELANTLGTAYSDWWKSLESRATGETDDDYLRSFSDSEWVAVNRINPTTRMDFSSWSEYDGQIFDRGGNFSQQQLYNLSNRNFDLAMFGWNPLAYTAPNPAHPAQIWSPEDVVILTDGLCSSACALFVELMAHQAGARTISIGGRPVKGPMQTASGNRGARLYTTDLLTLDFESLNDTLHNQEVAARLPSLRDTGMRVNYATFNIRDQMRENDSTPLQFQYHAAQCRIYYTMQNVYNMSRLWRDVVAATWDDTSLCVQDSTGYSTGPNITERKAPPKRTAQAPGLNVEIINEIDFQINSTGGLVDTRHRVQKEDLHYTTCDPNTNICPEKKSCREVPYTCPNGKTAHDHRCLARCRTTDNKCNCRALSSSDDIANLPPRSEERKPNPRWPAYNGFCAPDIINVDPARDKLLCPES